MNPDSKHQLGTLVAFPRAEVALSARTDDEYCCALLLAIARPYKIRDFRCWLVACCFNEKHRLGTTKCRMGYQLATNELD
jgi:hypothetical protein